MIVFYAVLAASLVVGALRWLRVSQREQYVPGRNLVLVRIWLSRSAVDRVGAVVAVSLALTAAVISVVRRDPAPGFPAEVPIGVAAAATAALVPYGLSVRGRTSRLAWTARLRRLAGGWVVLIAAFGAALWLLGPATTAVLAVTVPLTMDLALAVMGVVERRLSAPFVAKAQRRLRRVRPRVVAITGSYGKTTSKGYVAHVLAGARSVVASPASFNNRLGLSRAVNDHLVDGTEVFVAEMGTFGPGEIRELCELFPPDIAVITTIGEAHLERMGSREAILAAKAEITERAPVVVLPVDDPLLAGLAERCREAGKRVISCRVIEAAGDAAAAAPAEEPDVVVDLRRREVRAAGACLELETVPHGVNLAVAVGVALALDVDPDALRLSGLPRAAHRAEVHAGPGVAVIDDTYNANPIGARAALTEAAALAAERGGPLVVVTPGIVELGKVQAERNAEFARAAAAAGAQLLVVGRTNRAALVAGAEAAGGAPQVVDRREQAVPVATTVAGERGVVLYENDLPDHYP